VARYSYLTYLLKDFIYIDLFVSSCTRIVPIICHVSE